MSDDIYHATAGGFEPIASPPPCSHDIAEGEWCCPCGLWYDPTIPAPTEEEA